MVFHFTARLVFPALLGSVAFGLVAASVSFGQTAMLVTLAGDAKPVEWQRCEQNGDLVFETDGKPRAWSAKQLVRWGNNVDSAAGPQVLMADGSCLVADQSLTKLQIADELVVFDSRVLGEELRLPMERLLGILFQLPADAVRRDQMLDRIRLAKDTADVVILDNGDELRGTIASLTDDEFELQTADGQTITEERAKIQALVFNPAIVLRPAKTSDVLLVHLFDGSRIMATKWSGDEDRMQMTIAGGIELKAKYKHRKDRGGIVGLQSFGPHVTYVSDLKPDQYRHRPYLSVRWPYHLDRNVRGARLRCGEQLFDKGLGMHSVASLTYRLDKPYERLEASVGIDDSTNGRGSVVYRVYIDDGSGKWQQRYQSEIVRGGDPPIPISVDIAGAKNLSLIVDAADRGDEQDHANWLDARLIPSPTTD